MGNIIDLSSNSKFETEKGLRRWAIKSNNKTFIQTMNEMMRLGIGSHKQLVAYQDQLQENIYQLDQSISSKKSELKEVKEDITALEQITKLFSPESGAETYLKLTPKIEEIFSQNFITFEQESFDKIKVDQELIDQIDDVLMEYRQNENTLVSELSDLISNKELNQSFETKIVKVGENYERYMSKDDRCPNDR